VKFIVIIMSYEDCFPGIWFIENPKEGENE
jgi:hypothetical protein